MRLLLLVMCLLPGQPTTRVDKGAKADPELQGRWKLVSLKFAGSELLEQGELGGKKLVVTIVGANATWKFGSENQSVSFKVDTSKKPRAIDLIEDKHRRLGIYEVRGKQLRIGVFPNIGDPKWFPNVPRPTDFSDNQEVGIMLFQLERP